MGVQILNKDVSVISSIMGKDKANISSVFGIGGWAEAAGFVSGDFIFNDVINTNGGTTNTQTSPKTGTLFIYVDFSIIGGYQDGVCQVECYKNGASQFIFALDNTSPPYESTLSISSGDTLYFTITRIAPVPGTYDYFDIVLKNQRSSGTEVDRFLVDLQ